MKKNAKRLLGLLIALAMMVSLVGTMALADSSTDSGKEPVVTYIGTSVSSGFFLPQNNNKWEEKDWEIIKKEWTSEDFHGSLDDIHLAYRPYDALAPDSAPRIIAEKLGLIEENDITNRCDNFHKMCFTGLRTKEALRFLYGKNSLYDLSCRSDWLSEAYMNEGHYSGFTTKDRDDFYNKAQTWIKKSDIVIVELGGNDVMTTVIDNLFDERGTLMRTVKVLNARALHDKLVDIVKKGGDLSSVVITALDAAQKAGELPLMMTAMTKALLEGTMMFYTNYGKVIKRIYELNPEATVLAVGTFNPLEGVKISENLPLQAKLLMDPNIRMMNAYIKSLAPYALSSKYDYRYVDDYGISLAGIDQYTLMGLLTSDKISEFDARKTGPIHPNVEGHRYLANQILKAIDK